MTNREELEKRVNSILCDYNFSGIITIEEAKEKIYKLFLIQEIESLETLYNTKDKWHRVQGALIEHKIKELKKQLK